MLSFFADFVFCTYIILYILYMMTSVSNDRCRGAREKPQMPTTHAAQPQKQVVQVSLVELSWVEVKTLREKDCFNRPFLETQGLTLGLQSE